MEISKPPYPVDQQQLDRAYVIKKLGITDEDFVQIMALPERSYRDCKRLQESTMVAPNGQSPSRSRFVRPLVPTLHNGFPMEEGNGDQIRHSC